jgi:hypothetical protein
MKSQKGRVLRVLVCLAVAVLCAQTAHGFLEVQVMKNDKGQETYHFRRAPDSAPVDRAGAVSRQEPYFSYYYDFNGDSVADLMACGEDQGTGQVYCEVKNMLTNGVISHFNVLDPGYEVGNYLTVKDFTGGGHQEALACGMKYSDRSVACQVINPATGTVVVPTFTAVPAGIDPETGYSLNTYVNVDGDWNTPEIALSWKKASTEQIYCRVLSPATRAVLMPTTPVLTPAYDFQPYSVSFTDVNANNKDELYCVARNRATGQTVCQFRNGETGSLIKDVGLLTSSDYVRSYQIGQYETSTTAYEIIACGWNTLSKQPWCQIKRINNTVFKTVKPVLLPKYVP